MNKIFIFVFVFGILTSFYGENFKLKKLTYKILDGEKITNNQFQIGINDQGYILKNPLSLAQFDNNYATLNYEVFDNSYNILYKASRKGKTLEIKGHDIDIIFPIDNEMWCQSFASWLPVFIKSNENSIKFWMITGNFDPDSKEKNKGLMIRKFILKKDGIEKLLLDNVEIETMRVIVTVPDARSAFWKTKHWFRPSDGVRIKYEENRGPGTKTIFGELIKEEIIE